MTFFSKNYTHDIWEIIGRVNNAERNIFSQNEIKDIIELYNNGISCKKIANRKKCSKQTINKLLRKNNVQLRDNSHCGQKYVIDENVFEKINSYEKAYWLGMITGDGWVTIDGQLGLSLQQKDSVFIEKFRDFLKSNHPIKIVNNRNKKDGTASISHEIRIYNKKIISDLKKYGILPNKTLKINFPNIDDEFLSSYMLGLIDSDGCFCLKRHYKNENIKHLNFSFVGPTEFVERFQEILVKKLDISKTKLDLNKKTLFIRTVNYGGYKHIYKIVKFLYSKCPVWMPRKKNIAINYLLSKYPDDKWLLNNSTSS